MKASSPNNAVGRAQTIAMLNTKGSSLCGDTVSFSLVIGGPRLIPDAGALGYKSPIEFESIALKHAA
jgi:hypothetical protein